MREVAAASNSRQFQLTNEKVLNKAQEPISVDRRSTR